MSAPTPGSAAAAERSVLLERARAIAVALEQENALLVEQNAALRALTANALVFTARHLDASDAAWDEVAPDD